ncbi:hypothetical protein NQZ68_032060 [Dissostichus eleginoides]|nr:hypothetical protein NQZ68_032060 [Dissostichus eleginoides]
MWKQTTTTFPNATIYIPIINFSNLLNPQQQTLLTAINNTIALTYNFIPEINPLLFRVNNDNIHWTTQTAKMLLSNQYLQLCGCAMGRKYAPAHADIYLAHWEETFIKLTLKPLPYVRICTFGGCGGAWTLFSALRPRGYSRRFLRSIKAEVGRTFTDRYQDTSTRPSGPALIPLITTYSSSLGSLLIGLKANFEGSRADCDARRGRTLTLLKDNSATEAPRISEVGFIRLPHILNPFSKLGANPGQALQPTTKTAVYSVRCRACHKLFVRETRHEISLRIKQHLYRINSGDGTSVLYLHVKLDGPENLFGPGEQRHRDERRRASKR